MSDLPQPEDSTPDGNWIDEIVPEPIKDSATDSPGARPRRRVAPGNPIVLVETAFLASAASLIWFINFYFPLGPLLQIFFPAPIALIYQRWGQRAAWMAALVSGLLLTIMMGPVRSIQYTVPYGLLGVLLGYLWTRKARWRVGIFWGTILATLGSFFRIWLVSLLLGDDLWLYSTSQVTGFLEWLLATPLLARLMIEPSLGIVQLFAFGLIVLRNWFYLFAVHVAAWFLFERLGDPISDPPRWVQAIFDEA
jgi:uncharacterized protein YybS (DUF2232 family)